MIPNVGPLEIAIVLVIALIVFGPKKLPELGRSVGSGIKEFRDGLSNIGNSDDDDDDDDEAEEDDLVAISPAALDPEVTEISREGDGEGVEAVDGEVVAEPRD